MNIEKEGELFEQWWENEGQYHRAGGNEYCKTFAWESWIAAKSQIVPEGFVLVEKNLIKILHEELLDHEPDSFVVNRDICELWKQAND